MYMGYAYTLYSIVSFPAFQCCTLKIGNIKKLADNGVSRFGWNVNSGMVGGASLLNELEAKCVVLGLYLLTLEGS